MRLEFESNASTLPFVENQAVSDAAPSEGEQLLRTGVKAAQEGRRSEAKALLLRVTELEPENENAWLWLASISEYPEELLVFLNNVLHVNPENTRALDWKKATHSLLAKTLIQRGINASREERKHFARQCFEQAVEHDPENELGWLWLASVADSDAEKSRMFEKVLELNPENETALTAVQAFRNERAAEILRDAVAEAVDGHHSAAHQMLAIVLDESDSLEDAWVLKAHLSASFEERAEALLKIKSINPENEMARACLASWRSLTEAAEARRSEMPAVESDQPTAEASFAPEQSVEEPAPMVEVPESNFPSSVSERLETMHGAAFESSQTDLNGFDDGDESMSLSGDNNGAFEPQPAIENFGFSNGYASPDSPTQDLSSLPGFRYEPEQAAFEASPEPVGFRLVETEASAAAEIEAEEIEMSAAFDDGHTNSATDLEPDLHIPLASDENFEPFQAERAAEAAAEHDEEWKNTSPDVFFGYVPKDSFGDEDQRDHADPLSAEASNEIPMPETGYWEPAESPAEQQEEAPFAAAASFEMQTTDSAFFDPAGAEPHDFRAPEAVSSEAPEPEPEHSDPVAVPNDTVSFEYQPRAQAKDLTLCPFCNARNERQVLACGSCHAVLSLTDLESVFNHNDVNVEVLEQAVASFEREHESFGLSAVQLAQLGLGHINLKNFRQGYLYLLDAVRANPSNVVLDAQVNAFAIRLAEMEKQQTAQESKSKNRKILVVDDSPTVRKLISSKLEKCGHEVVSAVDGVDALEKLNGLNPDLILLDITMPRMDGYQVCKLIRNNADMKDVPIVMISGKDGFFDKVRGRMAGTTDYITKPFGPETLMKTVENYLA